MDTKPRRRWFRFSFPHLLILAIALYCAMIGFRMKGLRDYDRAIARVRSCGFTVYSHHENKRQLISYDHSSPIESFWWRVAFGEDRVASSIMALEDGPPISDDVIQDILGDLQTIGPLEEVHLKGNALSDKALRDLEPIPMKYVWLYETTVTDAGIAQLKKAQPSCLAKTWPPGKAPRIPEWLIHVLSARKQVGPNEHEFIPLGDLPLAIDPDNP